MRLQKGTSFWFYTWQDCDLIYSTRNIGSYCDRNYHSNCGAFSGNLQARFVHLYKSKPHCGLQRFRLRCFWYLLCISFWL